MKTLIHRISLIVGLAALSASTVFAQPDIEPINPTTIVNGTADEFLLQTSFDIKNNTDQTLYVKVRRNELEIVEGTLNYFCWHQCYTPNTSISPTGIEIAPGESVPNFYADYQPFENEGSSFVEYCFFDDNNTDTETCVTIEFRVGASLSVQEPVHIDLGYPQPNPAVDQTFIPFELKTQNKGASLVIYNLLGSEIKRQAVTGISGNIELQVSDLQSGLYIYSFFNGNELLSSNRLVVR
jgi:hypothetical protein